MHFTCNKSALAAMIVRVQGALTEKSFAKIGLKCENNLLRIAASDRILSIFSQAECTVEHAGTSHVPARLFCDVVRELPEGDVQVRLDHSQVVVTAGRDDAFLMKLPTLDDAVWEDPPSIDFHPPIDIAPQAMKYMIDQVQFCISADSQRNYGSVAYLHMTDDSHLRIVGTDGFRLSYCDTPLSSQAEALPKGVCVSKRALGELAKMCDEGVQASLPVNVCVSSDLGTLAASMRNYELFIQLSAVRFPDYQGVVPRSQPFALKVPKQGMQAVVKRVLLAADKNRALHLSFGDKTLTLSSRTMGSSEGRERVNIEDYRGPAGRFSVNGKFLFDALTTTSSNEVNIHFDGEDKPVVLVPDKEISGFTSRHVLVPIKEN